MAEAEKLLGDYPSIFLSLQRAGVKKEDIVIDELQDEEMEDINVKETRAQNLLAYAHFVLDDTEKAWEINEKVLRQHSDNVIALTNKIWFLSQEHKTNEAQQVRKALDMIKYKDVALLVARGDIAYAFARFKLKTYVLAIQEYENLLKEGRRPGARVPDKYFCMWSFGLFLLLHRNRKMSKTFTEEDSASEVRRLGILREVVHTSSEDETVKLYQAKCYANICRIRYDQINRTSRGKERYQLLRQEPLKAAEKAYQLGYNDGYTLDLIGKFMKYYIEKLETAIDILKQSIKLRPTTKNYHRLALAQKRRFERQEFDRFSKAKPYDPIANVMKCPKNPTKLTKFRDDKMMKECLQNLKRATELDPKNMDAYYDLGLTYRQLGEDKRALETFEHIFQFREGSRTLLQIANAYEQAGFCMSETVSSDIADVDVDELQKRMQSAFKKSVELSCSLVRMVPSLDQQWETTPTLQCLLERGVHTSGDVKEVQFLYERLMSQTDLEILRKLKDIDGRLAKKDRRVMALIDNLSSSEQYDDAILAMDMITCLPSGFEALDDDKYVDVFVRGGLDAFLSEEALISRLRLTKALAFRRSKVLMKAGKSPYEILDEDIANLQGTEVILIYDSDSSKEAADAFVKVLEEIGLKINVFSPSQKVMHKESTAMVSYIAIVDGNGSTTNEGAPTDLEEAMADLAINNFNTNIECVLEDLAKRDYGNLLVIKLHESTVVPEELQEFTTLVFGLGRDRQPGCLENDDLKFIASALVNIANA